MTVEELMETLATLPKTATVILEAWPTTLLEAFNEGIAEGDTFEFGIEAANYERGEAVLRLGPAPGRPASSKRIVAPGPERPQ